jgi:16S rRNA (guanine1207-N2)-methyltransferase
MFTLQTHYHTNPPTQLPPMHDPAFQTLMRAHAALPIAQSADVLFLRARAGAGLLGHWRCVQSARFLADALSAQGLNVTADAENVPGSFARVLLLPPRQRTEARALLAQGLMQLAPGALLLSAAENNEGARSMQADMEALAGSVGVLSKNKCRAVSANADALNLALAAQWLAADQPHDIADGFRSRPGLFAWDHVDPASALLASVLPHDLVGVGADLGAGFGYLSAEVLRTNPGVSGLDLYEAEHRALPLAKHNLQKYSTPVLRYFWHDVARGLPHAYDFIVSNPPFHQSRADVPELGIAFLHAAAQSLRVGGRFLLVANRHLPYETFLSTHFASVRSIIQKQGFKVLEAIR